MKPVISFAVAQAASRLRPNEVSGEINNPIININQFKIKTH